MVAPLRVVVTGAAGQIGYSLVLQIAKGDVFDEGIPIVLILFDIPTMADALEGIQMELIDCALPDLIGVEAVTSEKDAFTNVDFVFLAGSMPRKEGMERNDLLAANVRIFKSQGKALAEFAKSTTKVLVVSNPANTNAFICAKYASRTIPARNFSSLTRLDHNRAVAQIAIQAGVTADKVKNVIVWGNHSNTQFPDASHAKVIKNGIEEVAVEDEKWLRTEFISTVRDRGGVIIEKRNACSAFSAAKAACDHMHDWINGTPSDSFVSMAVPSDGSYGVPEGLIFSFPVTISNGEWTIVKGLELDEFAKEKIALSIKELLNERDEALVACEENK